MTIDKCFTLGDFTIAVHYTSKERIFDILVSFPFFSFKYLCSDVYTFRRHQCRQAKDKKGYCVHYPYNYMEGVHSGKIIEAFENGGYESVNKQFK
jgi:hypothetical protein